MVLAECHEGGLDDLIFSIILQAALVLDTHCAIVEVNEANVMISRDRVYIFPGIFPGMS